MIIAIDFDGTIVYNKASTDVEGGYSAIGELKPNVKSVINRLHEEGHNILIWTCRTGNNALGKMIQFLDENEIKYDTVNQNSPFIDRSNWSFIPFPKILADIYIDDRQLGGIPDDWNEIYYLIELEYNKRKLNNDSN